MELHKEKNDVCEAGGGLMTKKAGCLMDKAVSTTMVQARSLKPRLNLIENWHCQHRHSSLFAPF